MAEVVVGEWVKMWTRQESGMKSNYFMAQLICVLRTSIVPINIVAWHSRFCISHGIADIPRQ